MNRRTAIITSAAVTGIVLVGTTAVAANVSILRTADDDPVGELTVTSEGGAVTTGPPTSQLIEVVVAETTPTSLAATSAPPDVEDDTVAPDQTRQFVVEDAATVSLIRSGGHLDVDDVVANDGWRWTVDDPGEDSLVITFESATTTYVLTAELDAHGAIVAHLEEPVIETVEVAPPVAPPASARPAPTPATGTAAPDPLSHSDDDHDDHDEYDEHDEHDEYDEHDEHDEYEGRDDDD